MLEPLINRASSEQFAALATHLKSSFICAGSFPAFILINEIHKLTQNEKIPRVKYNDIDIYYGSFGDGNFKRIGCQ